MYRRERNSLERPHKEVGIQRKTLRRRKNLTLSKDTNAEKVRDDAQQMEGKIETNKEIKKREVSVKITLVGVNRKEARLIFARIER